MLIAGDPGLSHLDLLTKKLFKQLALLLAYTGKASRNIEVGTVVLLQNQPILGLLYLSHVARSF